MPSDDRLVSALGFTPEIGTLVGMLQYTRRTTLDAVHGLEPGQLDWSSGAQANSIGALLAHMAAVEWAYSVATFERREPTAEEKTEWRAALLLGPVARERYSGWTLNQYEALLAQVRQNSLQRLAHCDDAWLDREFTLINDTLVNFRWAWFHIFEDELSHRGQILLIRNHLLPSPAALSFTD
ncbi:DinB family protein [Deinococcus oregonensis]|uniref:DinB family protein n=1 Tax=Deinococcus oregonensis TaxID=1805970 RepID=A0ABV6B0P8_9DEIO